MIAIDLDETPTKYCEILIVAAELKKNSKPGLIGVNLKRIIAGEARNS